MNEDISRYKDIIKLPHHTSKFHPRLSMEQRAAQFSPFAALTGYEEATNETSRLTDEKIEFSDDKSEELNRRLQNLKGTAAITYFVKDEKKSGGAYVTVKEKIKRIDEVERILILSNKEKIPIDDILDIECLED